MTNHTVGTSITGPGIQFTMDGFDEILIMSYGAVGSTESYAILGAGSYNTVNIQGAVSGEEGSVVLGGNASQDAHNSIYIGHGGYVAGSQNHFALRVTGHNSTVENFGTIWNKALGGDGIEIVGDGSMSSQLINAGSIDVAGTAIRHGGSEDLYLENTGMISGDAALFVPASSSGSVHLLNTGRITGDVALWGSADDVFDTRGGVFEGHFRAGNGNDLAFGSKGSDSFWGEDGDDRLSGFGGDDFLFGGLGKDRLSGGAGADTFAFGSLTDSTLSAAGRDLIAGFSRRQHDKIDLHDIDAQSGNMTEDDFDFIGDHKFHGVAGELRAVASGNKTKISADTDGDGSADFMVWLDRELALTSTDFNL